jgi:hypothetical protein
MNPLVLDRLQYSDLRVRCAIFLSCGLFPELLVAAAPNGVDSDVFKSQKLSGNGIKRTRQSSTSM